MKIYFATWLRDYTNGPVLTKVKASNRLISYHLYQEEVEKNDYPKNALKIYQKLGEFESRKTLRREQNENK